MYGSMVKGEDIVVVAVVLLCVDVLLDISFVLCIRLWGWCCSVTGPILLFLLR